jgi:hypothetical protein
VADLPQNSLCDLAPDHEPTNLALPRLLLLAARRPRAQRRTAVVLAWYHDGPPGDEEVVGEEGVGAAQDRRGHAVADRYRADRVGGRVDEVEDIGPFGFWLLCLES